MSKKIIFWGLPVLFVGVILGLTHDIIFTNILAYRICKADPNPKTFIRKTVEYPDSIYWEDNIYPGFDEEDRLLMIRNYLDGVHLKTMALNGPDGKIYLYTATEKDWQTSRAIHARKKAGNYYDTMAEEASAIASRGRILSREELGQMNYQVMFNPVPLTPFQKRYLYSDEVVISDNKANGVIAYNRRLLRSFYFLLPNFGTDSLYYPHALCGSGSTEGFDGVVLTEYNEFISTKHTGKANLEKSRMKGEKPWN